MSSSTELVWKTNGSEIIVERLEAVSPPAKVHLPSRLIVTERRLLRGADVARCADWPTFTLQSAGKLGGGEELRRFRGWLAWGLDKSSQPQAALVDAPNATLALLPPAPRELDDAKQTLRCAYRLRPSTESPGAASPNSEASAADKRPAPTDDPPEPTAKRIRLPPTVLAEPVPTAGDPVAVFLRERGISMTTAETVGVSRCRGAMPLDESFYNPPVVVEPCRHERDGRRFLVVRDDLLTAGTKQRALVDYLRSLEASEVVYAGPVTGYAQVALAMACNLLGKRATVVLAMQQQGPHSLTKLALHLGATALNVPQPNFLNEVQNVARCYVDAVKRARGASTVELAPFGLHDDRFLALLEQNLRRSLPPELLDERPPERVWLVAGSATILTALSRIWPKTHFNVVQVGKKIWPDQLEGFSNTLYVAPEHFEAQCRHVPPYPSVATYDAKLWQFVLSDGRDGDLIWNVAADPPARLDHLTCTCATLNRRTLL